MRPGAFIFGCAGTELTDEERAFYAASQPFGFILFARNVQDPQQMARLTGHLREAVGRDAPVLIDQEGGRVQRMGPPHWRQWLPPLDFVRRTGDRAARAMWLRYRVIAAELAAVGIDTNCIPCADVATAATHPFLKNRCYGEDPEQVAQLARAAADGLAAGGLLPVMKHLPGHGRAAADSHGALPTVPAPLAELETTDFLPFRRLRELPMAMTAHVVYAAIDERPATVSPPVVRLIRDDIGFDGLLLTDDISMDALSGDVATRGRAALDAGCDLVLHSNGSLAEMQSLADAAGEMRDVGLRRAAAALAARHPPDPLDMRAALDELADLEAAPDDGG